MPPLCTCKSLTVLWEQEAGQCLCMLDLDICGCLTGQVTARQKLPMPIDKWHKVVGAGDTASPTCPVSSMLPLGTPPLPGSGRPGGSLPTRAPGARLVPAPALPGVGGPVRATCRAQAALRPAPGAAQEHCLVPARVAGEAGCPPSPGDRRQGRVAGCVMHCE